MHICHMCLSGRDDVWPTWELTYGLTQQIAMVMYKISSYMLPAGMNYLRKIQLETQRELVHNWHPDGPVTVIRTPAYNH